MKRTFTLLLSAGVLLSGSVLAQKVTIPVETAHNAVVLQVSDKKDLTQVYFGEKLSNTADYA